MTINPEDLADAIAEELSKYTDEVCTAVKAEAKKVAAQCTQELKANSPTGSGKKAGSYAKGWRSKVSFENAYGSRVTVHNKNDPQLSHLLENGHALHNGGRSPAIPHIQPARDRAEETFQKRLEEILRDKD